MSRLPHRWRTQQNAIRNANCRTRESSNLWTQVALVGNPASMSVWVSAKNTKIRYSECISFVDMRCLGVWAFELSCSSRVGFRIIFLSSLHVGSSSSKSAGSLKSLSGVGRMEDRRCDVLVSLSCSCSLLQAVTWNRELEWQEQKVPSFFGLAPCCGLCLHILCKK